MITSWPLYPRERTHLASCVSQSRSARFGEENKSLAKAGIESRIVCVRTRVTVNRNSGYSNDFFIRCHYYLFIHCHHCDLFVRCHHYDFSYAVIIATFHMLSSLRFVHALSSLLVHTMSLLVHILSSLRLFIAVIIANCSCTVIVTCSYTVIITCSYSHHYLFISHHYDFSYAVINTTCSYTVTIATCSYAVIVTTLHTLS